MFSPPPIHNLSNLTSKRRQRPVSSEITASEPQKKRRRSAIASQKSPISENTHQTPEKNTKITSLQVIKDGPQGRDLAVRAKKSRTGDREHKGDGSIILSSNDMYTVAKLPALPDRLHSEPEKTAPQHGAIYTRNGYALLLTHKHAMVWLYSVDVTSPETFVFALSKFSTHPSDPLPIGGLVSASASSSIPGLVVIIPSTGKVIYWESISSAATYDLKLQRNGVESSIPNLSTGETVIQITNAESAGFILAFSSGRIAYMSVRDAQGRPAISIQFLKIGFGAIAAGIFGSIRNALSSSSSRIDIAAVRAMPAKKVGERDLVLGTTKGKFQCWRTHRGGHISMVTEHDTRETIILAVKTVESEMSDIPLESFELLDFTFIPNTFGASEKTENEECCYNLLILASLVGCHRTSYFLTQISIKRNQVEIRNVLPIRSYTSSVNRNAVSKARLYLPRPGLVAFVVFDRAVVVLSTAKLPNFAESQLQLEKHLSLRTFDDVIDFQHGKKIEIVGSGMEELQDSSNMIEDLKSYQVKAKQPAVVLLVRSGGVLRISATDVARLATNNPQQVNAKTKLEQAVFYGWLDQNPLSFALRPELKFSDDEFGAAAVELSDEILRSKTSYISTVAASVEQNLQKRSVALRSLANFLRCSKIKLDRLTKWKLLTDAEKMKAAMLIWKRYDTVIKNKCPGEKRGLLTEVVESIHEDYKTEPVPEAGELDRIRHWFVNDIWNMEISVPWAHQICKYMWQDNQKNNFLVFQTISEANDVIINAIQGAFEFREANLDLYDLSSEQLEHGILIRGYEGLPELWTSTVFISENTRKHTGLVAVICNEYYKKMSENDQASVIIKKIRSEYSSLLDISIRSNYERIRWCSAQGSLELQTEAKNINDLQNSVLIPHFSALSGSLNLPDEALDLAEKHQLLDILAMLLKLGLDTCAHMIKNRFRSESLDELIDRQKYLQSRNQDFFLKFGSNWANALCEAYLINGSAAELLDSMSEHQNYLTVFLRSRPEYAKISWINDVIRERDFHQSSQALLSFGLKLEPNSWCKKVTLSIGKLSLLASQGHDHLSSGDPKLSLLNSQIGLIKIQEEIHRQILPAICDAIDENAELQLAIEYCDNRALEKQTNFKSTLHRRISSLVSNEAMTSFDLVDLLTLMDTGSYEENTTCFGYRQFYLALKAISLEPLRTDKLLMQRIIWRRCLLRDDWVDINNTNMKDDEKVSAQSRATFLYQTLMDCFQFSK